MDDLITHLQTKPEHHRRRIALGVSTGITAIIFVLWVSVMTPRSSQVVAKSSVTPAAQSQGETPLATLKTSAAQAFQGIKEILGNGADGVTNVDLNSEYNRIKGQVENGDIKLTPEKPSQENY